jgi:hypothetical protein
MAGVDLRTVAELMGHSSIQMTMRYAHLAPQHNRAAVDRLVPLSEPRRAAKKSTRSAKRGNGLVTKSVTSRKKTFGWSSENQTKSFKNNNIQTVAP